MKKFLKTFLVLVICVCTCLGFAGCKKNTKLSETTNIYEGVVSNGGVVLYYDGYIYFVNGTKSVSEANVKDNSVNAGIYRVKTKEGTREIEYKETSTPAETTDDSEGNKEEEKKEFAKVERVVSTLTGFDQGSIFIFGDFLYYATPCTQKNRDGDMLIDKIVFKRYDLKNKREQTIYTTQKQEDKESVKYAYYRQGTDLDLVVYEPANDNSLTSIKIGKKMKTNFVKKEVTSCILSENYGDSYAGLENSATDNYIYYTLTADQESTVKDGSRVFRCLPDGTEDKMISEGHSLTLIAIKADHLLYSEEVSSSTHIYAQRVNAETTELTFDANNAVTYKQYEQIVFFEDGGKIKALVFDGTWIRIINYQDGELDTSEETFVYELKDDDKIAFLAVYNNDYIVYQLTSSDTSASTNLLYKIKFRNISGEEENFPIKLTTTKFDSASGLMVPEIVDGYIYGFYTDTSAKVTYLYRVNLLTPEERGEQNEDGTRKDVGEAEFVGVRE